MPVREEGSEMKAKLNSVHGVCEIKGNEGFFIFVSSRLSSSLIMISKFHARDVTWIEI